MYQLYQEECATFVQLQEHATTQHQQYTAGVQHVRGEFVEAEQVFFGICTTETLSTNSSCKVFGRWHPSKASLRNTMLSMRGR